VDDWIGVINTSDLHAGDVVEITCHGQDLLLYRTPDGACHAVTAYCPHLNNYMPNGLPPGTPPAQLLQDDELHCPYHGWLFNVAGQCIGSK
jgi:phenylpropionate dioxygenase-like ring-hydroxylating dioxygenase large terminal subunit